jgi:hypothetical protein
MQKINFSIPPNSKLLYVNLELKKEYLESEEYLQEPKRSIK